MMEKGDGMSVVLSRPCIREPKDAVAEEPVGQGLREAVASSEPMRRVISEVERVAPTDFTVLVMGETGAGKEVAARMIHRLSRRAEGPFVAVDCGSIPATLIESELFGHEKGSFTGAEHVRLGKFELASGGTLFLDEISNLSLDVQPKLLRALQDRHIWRVGATKNIPVDIRVIAATNQELSAQVRTGKFRRDLYHRLNEFGITIPALRERRGDILMLANRFLELTNRELKKNVCGITDEAARMLLAHRWPGNVRELRNVVRRAVLLAETTVEPCHLGLPAEAPETERPEIGPVDGLDSGQSLRAMVRTAVEHLERRILSQVLQRTGGNKAEAARLLHVDYKTIHKKTREYGIPSA